MRWLELLGAVSGLARYLRKKQREEIRAELFRKRGFKLSAGSVSNLCDRFLHYLEVLHLVRSPYLKAVMQEHGYPLHIDATSEYGKGGMFVCMDGFKKWVLCAGKIESESEEHFKPFVERTIELFGDPIAAIRDLGKPGKNAVAPLAQRGIPDFVCHYHFLGVVGEKLLDKPYALLRNILKQSLVRSDLRQLLKDLKFYRRKDPKKRTHCIHSVCRTSSSPSDTEMLYSAPTFGRRHLEATSKNGHCVILGVL